MKTAQRCDFQRAFEACYESLDKASADLQKAAGIVTRLGYTALVRQTDDMIKGLELRRTMIKSTERTTRTLSGTPIYHPKTLKDVLVTERFIPPPEPVPEELTAIVEESRRSGQVLGGFSETAEAGVQYVDGLMHELRGNQDAALSMFLKAIDTLERDRRSLRDDKSRGTVLENRIGFFYAAVRQLLEHRRYDEAFEVFERARSRGLSDLLASRTLGLDRPQEQQLFTQLMVLRTRIADAQGRLFTLAGDADRANDAQLATIDQQIRTLEGQYDTLSARVAAEAPRLQTLVNSQPATLKAFQQALRNEQSEALQYSRARRSDSPMAHHANVHHGEKCLPAATGTDGQSRCVAEEPRRSLRRI